MCIRDSYNGDPAEYSNRLVGRTVLGAQGYGAFVDILMDADTHLLIGDGTNMRYYTSAEKAPKKYQLMIVFEDDSFSWQLKYRHPWRGLLVPLSRRGHRLSRRR